MKKEKSIPAPQNNSQKQNTIGRLVNSIICGNTLAILKTLPEEKEYDYLWQI